MNNIMFYDDKIKILAELWRFCFVFMNFMKFYQNTYDFH